MEPSSTTVDGPSASSTRLWVNTHKEAVITCCICRKAVASKKAKLLPCLHTLCCPCEITNMNEGKLTCACCNQSCNANEIVDHFLMPHIDIGIEHTKCDNCPENSGVKSNAKSKCLDCDEFLCQECAWAHQRVKITKDHKLKELEESTFADQKCVLHPHEDLTWYCVSCDDITCRNCQLERHIGHQHRPLEEVAQTYRSDMAKKQEDMNRQMLHLPPLIKNAYLRIEEVQCNELKMKHELSTCVQQIQKLLNERVSYLTGKIEAASEHRRRTYADIKKFAETYTVMLKQIHFFIDAALTCNDKIVTRRSAQAIRNAIQNAAKVKQNSGDVVSALQLQVQLSLNLPVQEILGKLQSFGDLMIGDKSVNEISVAGTKSSTSSVPRSSPKSAVITSASKKTSNNEIRTSQPAIPYVQQHVSRNTFSQLNAQNSVHNSATNTNQPVTRQLQHSFPRQQNFGPSLPSTSQAVLTSQQQVQFMQQMQQIGPRGGFVAGNKNYYLSGPHNVLTQQSQPSAPRQQSPNYESSLQQMLTSNPSVIMSQQPPPQYMNRPPVSSAIHQLTPAALTYNVQAAPQSHHQENYSSMQTVTNPPPLRYPQQQQMRPMNNMSRLPQLHYGPKQNQPNVKPHGHLELALNTPSMAQVLSAATISRGLVVPSGNGAGITSVCVVDTSVVSGPVITSVSGAAETRKRMASGADGSKSSESSSKSRKHQPELIQLSPTPVNFEEPETMNAVSFLTKAHEEAAIRAANPPENASKEDEKQQPASKFCERIPEALKLDGETLPKDKSKELGMISISVAAAEVSSSATATCSKDLNEEDQGLKDIDASLMQKNLQTSASTTKNGGNRLARKSIIQPKVPENTAKLLDNNVTKSEDNDMSYLDNFPMTQAFIPNVDDDKGFVNDMGKKEWSSTAKTPIANKLASETISPLVIKQQKDNYVVLNSQSSQRNMTERSTERVTPDAGEVTTTNSEDNQWEDYCSVCQNGGDLICCDGDGCRRVFHIYDHIPQYDEIPSDPWVCGFCVDPKSIKKMLEDDIPTNERAIQKLTAYEQKSCERILLELFCNPDSLPFHTPVEQNFIEYYQLIKHPMDFSVIRTRLSETKDSGEEKYKSVEKFIRDLNRVFINCDHFNDSSSQTGMAGKLVAAEYKSLVQEYFPNKVRLVRTLKRKSRTGSNGGSAGPKKKRRRLDVVVTDSDDSTSCSSALSGLK